MSTQNKTPDPFLGADPTVGVKRMVEIVDTLSKILSEETAVVRSANSKGFFALQERKINAARAYQDGAADMLSRQNAFKAVPAPLKKELEAREAPFQDICAENRSALESMMRATSRLSERIMDAARESAAHRTVRYGASGRIEKRAHQLASTGFQEQV